MDLEEPEDTHKVEELWFDDADVIFQAGKLQFRVHRGILSARSLVFKDMFSIHQPVVQSIYYMGEIIKAEVIYLLDDPQEVHYLFLAIFDSSFFEPPPAPTTIEILAAILRLAHKYKVKYLLRRAVAHLNTMFPTDLETLSASLISSDDRDLWLRSTEAKLSMLRLIQPAYTASICWVLPSLFRRAVKIDLRLLFASAEWRRLPVEMQEKFLIFRGVIGRELEAQVAVPHVISHRDEECMDKESCDVFARLFAKAVYCASSPSDDALHVLWFPGARLHREIQTGYCYACAGFLVDSHQDVAQAYWDRYPSELGLPSWQTLQKEKHDFESGN